MSRYQHLVLALFFFLSFSQSANAAQVHEREYRIKAAFIANFIRYTHWKNTPQNSFRFCNIDNRVAGIFKQELEQETWFGLHSEFKLVTNTKALPCDILFVDKLSEQQWRELLSKEQSKGLLIVSETRGSSQSFSHINFFFSDNKLRFEINPQRLQSSDLSMSASLLRLARITASKEGNL